MRRFLTILTAAAILTAIAQPAFAGDESPTVNVSTFCDNFVPTLQVTNTSEYPVRVYAYPTSDGEGAVEQTIEPDASLLVSGSGPYVVYLALDKKGWKKVDEYHGTLPECEDPDAPPPCFECEPTTEETTTITTTIPEETTTVPENTTTTVAELTVETTTPPPTDQPTTTAPVTLPFTGANIPLLILAGLTALALGGLMVRSARADG